MATRILTCEGAVSIKDPDTGVWGGYTKPKNLLSLEVTKPEPTKIEDFSSRPDDSFASLLETKFIPKGQATVKLTTKDLVNRDTIPAEMLLLAVALGAKVAPYNKTAGTKHYFTFSVNQMELEYPTGDRNLKTTAGLVIHKEVPGTITGLHSGIIASVDTGVYTVTGAGWTIDALIGKKVFVTGGTGAGQIIAISDNTATTFTGTFSPVLDATSTFALVEATALTKDTDFTVDAKYGTLCPLSAGQVDVGDILHGIVDSYAITGLRYRGAVVTDLRFRLHGKAKDINSGEEGWLEIHEISAYSSAAQSFVASAESPEFKQLELTGDMLVPTGFTEPYTFDDALVYATA
jgi:hypothetical protein